MDESKNTTPTEGERMAGYRVVVLAQLLIEAEADMMAVMGLPAEDVTPERIQDAAIHSIQQTINQVSHVVVRDTSKDES